MKRFRVSVAFGIVIASVLAAVMAWQAARAGELSGNTDEDTRQNTVIAETLRLSDTTRIVSDLRTFGTYEEALLSARAREAAAEAVQPTDPEAALRLRRQAEGDRERAEAAKAEFIVAVPSLDPQTREPTIDVEGLRDTFARFTEPRIRELRPDALREQAREAGLRSERLTGLAALAIGAAFLLTLAELVRGQPARLLAGAGATVCCVVVVLYVIV